MKLRTIQARRSGGLTIIELMVSVTILIVMILMTNQILSASRKTISIAEDAIQANADARAVADALRNDLAQLTKQGFLAITYTLDEGVYNANPRTPPPYTNTPYRPHLVFTAVGDYTSRRDTSVTAKAALIDYGFSAKSNNNLGFNDPELAVVWRRARLLNGAYNGPPPTYTQPNNLPPGDLANYLTTVNGSTFYYATSLTDMCCLNQVEPRSQINTIICQAGLDTSHLFPSPWKDVPRMVLPPTNLTQVGDTWPYLVSGVQVLKIQWTDGSRDPATGGIRWFDPDNPKCLVTGVLPNWVNKSYTQQCDNPSYNVPEYDLNACIYDFSSQGGPKINPPVFPQPMYAALWTFRKQDNWPKAIRVELTVGMGVYSSARTYEIVIELPN